MQTTEIFGEFILQAEKPKELCNLKSFFITADNQELGSRFHSLTAKIHVDTFMKPLSYLICAFSLEL